MRELIKSAFNQKCCATAAAREESVREGERERATNLSSKVLANTAQNRILKTVNRILKTVNWKQYLLLYYRVFIILFKLFVGSFLQFLIYFLLFCKFSLSKSFVGWQFRLAGPRGCAGRGAGSERLAAQSWVWYSMGYGVWSGLVWAASFWNVIVSVWASSRVDCVCV